jgi:hypothetical protein
MGEAKQSSKVADAACKRHELKLRAIYVARAAMDLTTYHGTIHAIFITASRNFGMYLLEYHIFYV